VKKSHIGRWPRHVLTATVKKHGPQGAHSSIARGSTWARADRAIVAARRRCFQAITTVQDGGDPPGVDASYYHARRHREDLPRTSTWRETVLPEMVCR